MLSFPPTLGLPGPFPNFFNMFSTQWIVPFLLVLFLLFCATSEGVSRCVKKQCQLVSADEFETLGLSMMGKTGDSLTCRNKECRSRAFKNFFGCFPRTCSLIWLMLIEHHCITFNLIICPEPEHSLCARLFMKQHITETTHATQVDCDEKTLHCWSWFHVDLISCLA